MLKIKNLSYKYGNNIVIDRLSHDFECGKVTAIIGESGVGKTTLVIAPKNVDVSSIEAMVGNAAE